MITKTAKTFKKQAFTPAHLLIAPTVHLLQNIIAKAGFKNKAFQRKILTAFKNKNVAGNAVSGVMGGVIPEFAIGEKHMAHLSKNFFKELLSRGIHLDSITKRDLVLIRKLLRGDFVDALNSRQVRDSKIFDSLMSSIDPSIGIAAKLLAKKGESALKSLEQVWKENPLTGELLKGVGEQMGKVKKIIPSTEKGRILRQGITAGTTLGIAKLDPITGSVNTLKRVLDSSRLRNWSITQIGAKKINPVAILQDSLKDTFMAKPIRNAFHSGLIGRDKPMYYGLENTALDYVMNPVVNQMTNLAKGIGHVAYKHGITKEHINQIKNLAKSTKKV